MKDFAKSIRTNNSIVGNKAIVLKDGDVWVVLYANETKSKEFDSEAEARKFAASVGNSKVGNETVGPNWDKKRQLEDELRGWMTTAQKLTGEEKANAEKQIAEIRKELNDVKIKIAHGENKKAGNESIDKQTWSMFKGLSKDAEKEVGNEVTDLKVGDEVEVFGKKGKVTKVIGNVVEVFFDNSGTTNPDRSDRYYKNEVHKVGNARPKEQLLADVRELTKYIKDHPGQDCEKEKRLLGEAKEELDKNYGVIIGNETLGQWAKAKPRVINETAEEKKFGYVMREFDRGELKSGSGEKVTDPAQAKAIAYSESEKVKNDFFGDHIKILGIPDKPQEPAKPQNGLSRARNSMAKK